MEHGKIIDMGNGFYKIKPDAGYKLYNTITRNYYSEAVTKNVNEFKIVNMNI